MAKITRKPAKKSAPAKAVKKTKAAKKSAPAKATEAAAPKSKRRSDMVAGVRRDAKITVLVDENPKRGKSAERFANYATAKTVQEYLDLGGRPADVPWDVDHGFISLS